MSKRAVSLLVAVLLVASGSFYLGYSHRDSKTELNKDSYWHLMCDKECLCNQPKEVSK